MQRPDSAPTFVFFKYFYQIPSRNCNASRKSQEKSKHSTRRNVSRPPDSSTPPPLWPPSVEGIPIVEIQICQFLVDFRVSLLLNMQSVFSSPSHATLRPGLEGLTSTVLIALVGLEKQRSSFQSLSYLSIGRPSRVCGIGEKRQKNTNSQEIL